MRTGEAGRMAPNGEGQAEASRTADAGNVELSPEFQAEVRKFASLLPALTYYEVLDVARDADDAAIRSGFFERSKLYHPDRHFGKNVGLFGPLITEVYKRVVAAYDVLRDPRLRQAYDKMIGPAPEPQPEPEPSSEAPQKSPARRKAARSRSRGPSLRSRSGLDSPNRTLQALQSQLDRSRAKARRHLEEALERKQLGDWAGAASRIKLALAFDPRDEQLHVELAEVLHNANDFNGKAAQRSGDALLERGDRKGALEFLLEAAQLLPADGELAATVARLLFETDGDLALAAEFGERAAALDCGTFDLHKLMGRICRVNGDVSGARKHLQRAWELDPMDSEVKAELQSL